MSSAASLDSVLVIRQDQEKSQGSNFIDHDNTSHAPSLSFLSGQKSRRTIAALFLASPDSGFITGVTLPVEGGAVVAGAYMVEKYRRRKTEADKAR